MIHSGFEYLLTHVPAADLGFHHIIPAPDKLYASAGSTLAAAGIGFASGLIGRKIYPDNGIVPLHYALWFVLAYQIKEFVCLIERSFESFVDVGAYMDNLENISEDELDFEDHLRTYCWKMIHYKNTGVEKVDFVFCYIFNTRPYQEITKENVYEASFLEMCRFRFWMVFKSTVLDATSFSLAYRLCNATGFSLPARTSLPMILIIQSIVSKIIIIPALYTYVKFCHHLAGEFGDGDEESAEFRETWIKRLLPAM